MTTQFVLRIGYSAYETPEGLRRSIRQTKRMHCDRVMLFNSRGHIEPAHLDRDEILRRAAVMPPSATSSRAAASASAAASPSPSRKCGCLS